MEEEIKSWLNKTGYPLELYVHKVALSRGYFCEKSPMYSDVESGNTRELDVIAYKPGPEHPDYSYSLRLLFECKKSEKPLLVLCDGKEKRERFEHLFDHRQVSDAGALTVMQALDHLGKQNHDVRANNIGRFSESIFSGYSVVQAFSTSDENIYKGIMGIAKADDSFRSQYNKFFEDVTSAKKAPVFGRTPFQLRISVLVVDTSLWTVSLTNSGDLFTEETDWASLSIRLPWTVGKTSEGIECNIQVVKKESLEDFLLSVEQLHDFMSTPETISWAISRITKKSTRIPSFTFLRRLFMQDSISIRNLHF